MKIFKNRYWLCLSCFILILFSACTKNNDDTSFINSASAPSKLSTLFTITQDNTGLVTITPNGEGVSYYDVYFGDATTAATKVLAGKSTQHIYAEGNYTVKIVGHNISGVTTLLNQPLVVAFRSPENLVISTAIDVANNFKVNLSATANYATFFKVYFGEILNEIPQSFLQTDTLSHTYSKIGTYTIRVVAYSGSTDSIVATKIITIVDPLLLPIDFKSLTLNYAFTNFDGGNTTVINNPQVSGINTSSKVAQMVKGAGQVWGGSWIGLSSPIDFSKNKIFRMKVYSPRVGAKVLLKVENATNSSVFYQVETPTTLANTWEDLVFDFSSVNTSNAYSKITVIFDNGTVGDGSSNFTFLLDDIRLTNSLPASTIAMPVDFESTSLNYSFTDFNGGGVTVINNPHPSGINTSGRVAQMIKSAGATYGGSYLTLTNPVDFSLGKIITMKVYSPRVGAKVLLKFENLTDGTVFTQKEIATTTANTWELLTYDLSSTDVSKSYQKAVLIFDNGTMGDGSANYTFLFDDINQK